MISVHAAGFGNWDEIVVVGGWDVGRRPPLAHGHEPLDTDSTPMLEGEFWLMHNGFAQAEGVANLDKVPPTGCLIEMGYPKFGGGVGGYARYIAICPPTWRYGVSVGELSGGPAAAMTTSCTGIPRWGCAFAE